MKVCEVKICGMTRADDVRYAVAAGVDYIGFVCVPESPRYVSTGKLLEIVSAVKTFGTARKVGVFRDAAPADIFRALEYGCFDVIQLHGNESARFAERIAMHAEVWKGVTLKTDGDISAAAAYPCARIVCDSPGGGSGILCDWELAAELSARNVDVMLAGGITPGNARAAWERACCIGIDTSGGVESSPGVKDPAKISELMKALEK